MNHKNNNPDEKDPVINKSEKIESQERRALSVRSYYPGGGNNEAKIDGDFTAGRFSKTATDKSVAKNTHCFALFFPFGI